MISPLTTGFAATPALAAFRGNVALRMSGWTPQDAGDLPSSGWGGEAKAHSRDPTPTQLDPNDPKSKQTHIPQSETFEEYLRRRNGGGGAPAAPAAPPAQSYQPPAQSYSPPPQSYSPPPQAYSPPPQAPPPAYNPGGYTPPPPAAAPSYGAGAPAQDAGDLPSSGWGGEAKAHSRDPTPTQLDPNDPKSKQTHIPQGDSFEEYMRRRQQGF